jgi:parallel beta-helix repeat protein
MAAKLHPHATLAMLLPVVALTATGVTAVGGDLAPAPSELSCGDTITADTTLTSDLVDCPSNGIVIGADDITLDLNGHTVAGDDELVASCPEDEPCDVGVVNEGHDGVTVQNGSVRDFASGLVVWSARENKILNVSSSSSQFFGFVIAESTRSVVRGSSGDENPRPDGDGIGVFASRHLRIVDSTFRRNALGMHIEGSTDVAIERNRLSGNADMGIFMEKSDGNRVRGNRCTRNGECLVIAPGSRNVVVRNRASRDGGGIAIEKGHGNLVARNLVLHPRWQGIRLGVVKPAIGGTGTIARGNVVKGSGRDAFLVARSDRRGVLKGNRAIAAGDDGFDVRSSSTALRRNRAVRNADLGIEAVPGVTDGGANTARHNRDPRQCTHVSCR